MLPHPALLQSSRYICVIADVLTVSRLHPETHEKKSEADLDALRAVWLFPALDLHSSRGSER